MAKGEYAAGLRKNRVMAILNAIKQLKNVGVNKNKLIAIQAVEWGLNRKRLIEYVNDLIAAEMVKEIDGMLYPVEE